MTSEYVRLPAIARPDTTNATSVDLIAKKETKIESRRDLEKSDMSRTRDTVCATTERMDALLFTKSTRVMG